MAGEESPVPVMKVQLASSRHSTTRRLSVASGYACCNYTYGLQFLTRRQARKACLIPFSDTMRCQAERNPCHLSDQGLQISPRLNCQ